MSTYLVTGAGGFVGRELVAELVNRGERVVAVVRDGEPPPHLSVELVRGSVDDPRVAARAVHKRSLDGAFHLAAHAKVEGCERDPLGAWESNVRGTYVMLEALAGVPTVVATSDHVYGDRPLGWEPTTEDTPFSGVGGTYDVSKACADMIAMRYGRVEDVRVVRCANVYGPGDVDLSRLVPSICDDLVSGRWPRIRSDGTPVREYVYITDAVNAYRRVMERGVGGRAYNVAGPSSHSVLEVVQILCRLWSGCPGSKPGITYQPHIMRTRAGDIRQIRLDTTRIRSEVGWEPYIDIEYGLQSTLTAWYKDSRR